MKTLSWSGEIWHRFSQTLCEISLVLAEVLGVTNSIGWSTDTVLGAFPSNQNRAWKQPKVSSVFILFQWHFL